MEQNAITDSNISTKPSRRPLKWRLVIILLSLFTIATVGALLFDSNYMKIVNALFGETKDESSIYLGPNNPVKFNSGDTLCLGTELIYVYNSRNCAYDTNDFHLLLKSNRKYTFERAGITYKIEYDSKKCDTDERIGFEGAKLTTIMGCHVNITANKIQGGGTRTITKEITLGTGIYVEENTVPSRGSDDDPDRVSLDVLNDDPYIKLLKQEGSDKADNADISFNELWVSDDCPSGLKVCTQPKAIFNDGGGDGSAYNMKLVFATQRGAAKILFSPEELYDMKTKEFQLDHAKLTVTPKKPFYRNCGYYCQENDSSYNLANKGSRYNRVPLQVTYTEQIY